MSTIQGSAGVGADVLALYGTKATAQPVGNDAQDRFLKLLVTQMKNQDPLNPLDNAQVTTQLAQISTVNGIEKLNATIQAMVNSFNVSQPLQAVDMIGKGVLVPGSALQLSGGKAVFGVDLASAADEVKVRIQDASGREVQVIDLGAQAAGPLALAWDGKTADGAQAADGSYRFIVDAIRGGQKVDGQTLAFGSVQGISQGTQGLRLDVGTLGMVGLPDIKQIF
jgi:flagellar basal-body rod modification protein FlgD